MGCDNSGITFYARRLVALLLMASFAAPAARAEATYAGISYARAESEDLETGNAGLVIGRSPAKGMGVEAFYLVTIDEDEVSAGRLDADVTIDTYGLFVTYKTGTDDFNGYLKFKGGVAVVDLEFDFGEAGSLDDDTSGFAYGISFGALVGNGALEFSYLILPEFDDFRGIDVDAEVDLLGITYQWNIQ